MAAPRDRRHLILQVNPTTEEYSPPSVGRSPSGPPSPPDRAAHAHGLKVALLHAQSVSTARRSAAGGIIQGARPGIYVRVDGVQGFPLALDTLSSGSLGLSVASAVKDSNGHHHAIVFIPDDCISKVENRIEDYSSQMTKNGKPKNKNLVERMASLTLATMQALWTDEPDAMPKPNEVRWLEIWLRNEGTRTIPGLHAFADRIGAELRPAVLSFGDRFVALMQTSLDRLASVLDVLDTIAEVRTASEISQAFTKMNAREQAEWADNLRRRTSIATEKAPRVCVLDTGVERGHPLLAASLDIQDLHTYKAGWNTSDHDGHGTGMAGLALYGNLADVLLSQGSISLRHRLESVKIQKPKSQPHLRSCGRRGRACQ